jgi:uncharacterized membrane protein YhhN
VHPADVALASTAPVGLALAVMLAAERAGRRSLYGVAKTIGSCSFVAAVALALPLSTAHGASLLAGLVLSLAGDVLLVPKDRRPLFLAGLGAFLIAHAAYAAAFAAFGVDGRFTAAGLALMLVVGAPLARWLLPHVRGRMRGPVVAYIAGLTAMVVLAIGAWGDGARWTLPVGALAFYVSDILVARERFVTPSKTNGLVGLPLYYGAQLLLIDGLRHVG